MIYYNRSLLEKAGLEDLAELSERRQWTWEALREYAIALTKPGPGGRPSQFGFSIPGFVNHAPLLWSFGADILSTDRKTCLLDSPEAVRAYRFLMGLRWKDRCCPTPAQGAQSAFTLESGRLGMAVDWMGGTPRLRRVVRSFEWDVCPMPAGPAGQWTTVKGNQLVMSAHTRHPDAAWRFMKHFVSPETEMFLYGKLRRAAPSRLSVMNDPEYLRADLPPANTGAFLSTQRIGRRLPIDRRWQEWSVVRDRHLDRLYNYPVDPSDVLPEMSREIEKVLRDEEGF
jgi:multiple sugar transport system substrate-binding protein